MKCLSCTVDLSIEHVGTLDLGRLRDKVGPSAEFRALIGAVGEPSMWGEMVQSEMTH